MRDRELLLLVPAFALALIVNAVLFGIAGLLTGERALPQDMSEPLPVSLVQITPPEPPVSKAPPPPPEKPKPKPRLEFEPELAPPALIDPLMPRIEVEVRPQTLDLSMPTGDLIFTEAELDQTPQRKVSPCEYPFRARQRGIEGVVRVKMLVRSDGTVGEIQILSAEPKGVFEDAVQRCVGDWRFEPGRIAGERVTAWVVQSVVFEIGQ